MIQWTKCVEAI